jgi:alkylation response protein AidB-like acyl-CoA dehydrogenase
MALMNGARLGIHAQSVGISESAYRESLAYAKERVQFGKAIIRFPAIYEMITTFLITPTARIAQDIAGSLVNTLWDKYLEAYSSKEGTNETTHDISLISDQDKLYGLVSYNNEAPHINETNHI